MGGWKKVKEDGRGGERSGGKGREGKGGMWGDERRGRKEGREGGREGKVFIKRWVISICFIYEIFYLIKLYEKLYQTG